MDRRLVFLATDEEYRQLKSISERDGITLSDLVREGLRHAVAERGKDTPRRGRKSARMRTAEE
ncbi:MAG: hypothetical protein ISN28_15555 [Ectothiorhodospiraceae bacterium AqS1]|nr:hypothetical protein [Ectothiorhodospiraceae bacterium AqS1]MBF2761648.1 hypothetical protein [Ectothiorhodospiraceae bacterium AqS1]